MKKYVNRQREQFIKLQRVLTNGMESEEQSVYTIM